MTNTQNKQDKTPKNHSKLTAQAKAKKPVTSTKTSRAGGSLAKTSPGQTLSARTGKGQASKGQATKAKASRASKPDPQLSKQAPQAKAKKRPYEDYKPLAPGKLRIIPLGGMREIGKNMTALEYGDDLIVVDVGMAFPDEDMPGIDSIIPDFTYIRKKAHKLRGVFLTHGHEDHIGAIAWFMQEFSCPIYGRPLTIQLANNKFLDQDRGGSSKNAKNDPRFKVVEPGDHIQAGAFQVEFIHVNHSIADACALAIKTPLGTIIHSGDFKVDFTPPNGTPIDLNRFAELGDEGVLGLIMESTNVERAGLTPSETMVGETFANLFSQIQGRIFVATFSSNVFRVQQIISAAEAHNRKFVILGYSMNKVFEAADSLGYIHYKPDSKIEIWDAKRFPDEQLVYITTGSQGEPMAALSRMAFSEHKQVNIKKGDTVILSSSAIPGNEKSIYRVINELFKIGADVIYESLADIHVSGHAYRGELELMLSLCKPQYFIPAHGEYRHLHKNAQLAKDQGIPEDRIFILNNGDVLDLDRKSASITDFIEESAGLMIDGLGVGDVDRLVLSERKLLADDGVVSCAMVVNSRKNVLAAKPIIQALGLMYAQDDDKLVGEITQKIEQYASVAQKKQNSLAQALRQNQLRDQISSQIYKVTKRRPMVIISVIDI